MIVLELENHSLVSAERILCLDALQITRGHIDQAAALLGVTRHSLRRRMIKHNIRRSDFAKDERLPEAAP